MDLKHWTTGHDGKNVEYSWEKRRLATTERLGGDIDATEVEARREEERANLPIEAEGRPPGESAMIETMMASGTIDVGGPVRVRRPPVRFGIEFVS